VRSNPVWAQGGNFKNQFRKQELDRSAGFSIWGSQIKSVEGRFGSGIGSYFRFLHFLLVFNLCILATKSVLLFMLFHCT
jgi:hypothetical protein